MVINTWPDFYATTRAWEVLSGGGSPIDAVVEGIHMCEDLQRCGNSGQTEPLLSMPRRLDCGKTKIHSPGQWSKTRDLAWLPWLTVSSIFIGYGDTSMNIALHTCTWYIHDKMDTEMNFVKENSADGAVYTRGDDLSTYTHVHRHVSHIYISAKSRSTAFGYSTQSSVWACSGVRWQPG